MISQNATRYLTILFAGWLMNTTAVAASTIIFDSFGPADSCYHCDQPYTIWSQGNQALLLGGLPDTQWALRIHTGSTPSLLESITVALVPGSDHGEMTFPEFEYLAALIFRDNTIGALPGAVLDSFIFALAPLAMFAQPVVTLTDWHHPYLEPDTNYWIGLAAGSTSTAYWAYNPDLNWTTSDTARFFHGWSQRSSIVPALRISVSEVPIPAAAWLLGSALGGLGWMRRKAT